VALAASGGSVVAPGAGGAAIGGGLQSGVDVQSGNVTVTATSDGITLASTASAMLRNQLSFSGAASSSEAGQTVEIERLGHETDWQWAPTAQATIGSDGSFSAVWQTDHIGRFAIRALISQPGSSYAASALPTVTVTIYRVSKATWYGPGFYGRRTACGAKLRPSTIGVANRTLRCGTKVAIYYRGRTLVVPVIDRGPYANGADWDLTEATGKALGIDGTAEIGAVSLPVQPPSSL
jgi:rare lipoprotein A (peptidoglycan hydrolase)